MLIMTQSDDIASQIVLVASHHCILDQGKLKGNLFDGFTLLFRTRVFDSAQQRCSVRHQDTLADIN